MTETSTAHKTTQAMGNQALMQLAISKAGKALPGYAAPLSTIGVGLAEVAVDPRAREAGQMAAKALAGLDPRAAAAAGAMAGGLVVEYVPPAAVVNMVSGATITGVAASAGLACFSGIMLNPAIQAPIAASGPAAIPLEIGLAVGAASLCWFVASEGAKKLGNLTALPVVDPSRARQLMIKAATQLH